MTLELCLPSRRGHAPGPRWSDERTEHLRRLWDAGGTITSNFQLVDSAFRTLIYAKMASNISDGALPSVNQILLNLFPNRGACFVTDGLNMTMTYTFDFLLSPVELAILEQTGVLPTPAGVAATIVQG